MTGAASDGLTAGMHAALAALEAACGRGDDAAGAEALNALSEAINTHASAAGGPDAARRDAAIGHVADYGLATLPGEAAGWLGVWLGAGVERGLDPERSGPAVLRRFAAGVDRLHPAVERVEAEEVELEEVVDDAQRAELACFERVGPAVVAHLSRSDALLEALRSDGALIQRVQDLSPDVAACAFVRQLLCIESGRLVVLDARRGAGLVARYEHVGNCFHLFTLLQAALPDAWRGRRKRTRPAVIAAATGDGPTGDHVHDEAWFHYGRSDAPTPDLLGMAWGEGAVSDLPVTHGERVLVCWPPVMASRGWGGGFFGPVLHARPPGVVVERELAEDEARGWFERLGLPEPTAKRRRWWPFR